MWQAPDLPEEEDIQFGKKFIYRGQEDTQVLTTETNMECPYCSCEFAEQDTDEQGRTYEIECPACEKEFLMYFDL